MSCINVYEISNFAPFDSLVYRNLGGTSMFCNGGGFLSV